MNSESDFLLCHPDTPARAVKAVTAQIERRADHLWITYAIDCPTDLLALPAPQKPYRADGLWRTTCFELFIRDDAGYLEFNFSPSSQWAAYSLTAYRTGMAKLELDQPPRNLVLDEGYYLYQSVTVQERSGRTLVVGLSAVVEEVDGTKSYWALAHPPSGPPDFHHPDCFALTLPAPGGA